MATCVSAITAARWCRVSRRFGDAVHRRDGGIQRALIIVGDAVSSHTDAYLSSMRPPIAPTLPPTPRDPSAAAVTPLLRLRHPFSFACRPARASDVAARKRHELSPRDRMLSSSRLEAVLPRGTTLASLASWMWAAAEGFPRQLVIL
jgi:hypothetical protein